MGGTEVEVVLVDEIGTIYCRSSMGGAGVGWGNFSMGKVTEGERVCLGGGSRTGFKWVDRRAV